MTFRQVLGLGLVNAALQGIVTSLASILNQGWWLVWVLIIGLHIAIATACIRRLGVINYLEAFFIGSFWFIGMLLFDLVVLTVIFKISTFNQLLYWVSTIIILLTFFQAHKKRHVDIRRQKQQK
jgi:hypothetical protein